MSAFDWYARHALLRMPYSPTTLKPSDGDYGRKLIMVPILRWARSADASKEELDRQYPWSKVSDETSFAGAVGGSTEFPRPLGLGQGLDWHLLPPGQQHGGQRGCQCA